jgi:iron complex transport system substrate-binding protein
LTRTLLILSVSLLLSCKNESHTDRDILKGHVIELKYAKGFKVTDFGTYKDLEIMDPWPEADRTYRYRLVPKEKRDATRDRQAVATIQVPLNRVVVTSTTHIPGLELLGMGHTLVGFSGTEYISSKSIRTRIDNGMVRDLGKNEGINTEVLLELDPELVIAFGIDGNNKSYETIKKSNIPVIFNGDWTESSPLGKAEWIKFFGLLFDRESMADSIFNTIEHNYHDATRIAAKVDRRPTVLSGAMYKDVWYLPYGTSPEARLLKDANTDYLWSDTAGSGSLALNFESVFNKAKEADIWLNPSNYPSLEALEKSNSHYANFKAFQNRSVYSFTNTRGPTGGTLYYELGLARPDLVLKDLIKICHPELLEDYQPFFFKQLK